MRHLIASLLVLGVACRPAGGGSPGVRPGPTGASGSERSAAASQPLAPIQAHLQVSVELEPGAEPRQAALECGGTPTATGFIQDAAAACQAVAAQRDFLVSGPPADRPCTMIYGGPQVAAITGVLDGKRVDREIRRANGCGIADWGSLLPLLGPPEPAVTPR